MNEVLKFVRTERVPLIIRVNANSMSLLTSYVLENVIFLTVIMFFLFLFILNSVPYFQCIISHEMTGFFYKKPLFLARGYILAGSPQRVGSSYFSCFIPFFVSTKDDYFFS